MREIKLTTTANTKNEYSRDDEKLMNTSHYYQSKPSDILLF